MKEKKYTYMYIILFFIHIIYYCLEVLHWPFDPCGRDLIFGSHKSKIDSGSELSGKATILASEIPERGGRLRLRLTTAPTLTTGITFWLAGWTWSFL